MTNITKSLLLKSAIAAVPLLIGSATASAQYRNNNDGRALDSNNRLGSGGYNSGKEYKAAAPSGNDVVTGNVTGLNYFHGRVDYTDPRAFRGNSQTFSNSDLLVRTAGDAPSPDNPNVTRVPGGRTFYGDNRAVPPPPNYQQIAPGVPGYIPSPQIQPRTVGDQRMGDISSGNIVDRPQADQLVLQGPTNQQGQQTSIVGSTLLGIRPTTGDEQFFLSGSGSGLNNIDRRPGMSIDDAAIARMRAELYGSIVNPNPQQNSNQNQDQSQTQNPNQQNSAAGASQLPNQPLDSQSLNNQLPNQPLDSQLANAPGAQTDQSLRQRLNVPPEKQSEAYRQMLQKYTQLESERKLTAEEASRAFNDLQRAAKQPNQQPGAPGAAPGQPGAAPGQPGAAVNRPAGQPGAAPSPQQQQPGAPGAQPAPAAPGAAPGKPGAAKPAKEVKKPEPVKVQSMAAGTNAKGLADLMKQAEDLMKQGKYNAALDKYDTAHQVAPNNPMISLGRAIAELGGQFYARAEGHIKDAFTASPALMVGQYDLRNLLGEERLGALVKDLRALADKEKRDPRPVFLLAFIAYNTDQPQAAEGYLDIADKRANGRDPFIKTLRDTWALPDKPKSDSAPATQPTPTR